MFTRLFIFTWLLALLAACNAASPTPAAGNDLATPLVLERSGGFAGLDDRLEIAPDGQYTVQRKGRQSASGQLSGAELAQLKQMLAGNELFTADGDFPAEGADLFTYSISYNGHTVTAQDGAVPEAMAALLDLLLPLIV